MQEHRGGIKLDFNPHISFPVLLLPLHLTPYLQSDQVPSFPVKLQEGISKLIYTKI